MKELVFKGQFEVKDANKFIEEFKILLKNNNVYYRGQIMQYDVEDFTDYVEIKDESIDSNEKLLNEKTNN